jgi:Ca-activated chloride channel homolog
VSFADLRWLAALIVVPVLLLLEILAARRARRALARLTGERPESVLRAQVLARSRLRGAVLRLAALAALIVGAAGPQWGREMVRRSASGSDVVLVLDVSASMDARDVAPSRLDEARREALAVLDRLEGSRVGVVAFAGDASRLCPLTLDRGAARLTIEALSSGSVSEPGTDLGRALRMAARVIPPGRREEQAVVLWTDGEDLERGARAGLEEVAARGVRVFTIGVGTSAGGEVPVLDDQGRAVDVKRAPGGGPVVSRLDEGLLRGVARRTHGAYFSATRPGGELPRLLGALGSLARSGRGTRLSERPVARFRLFAMAAVLLLALDLLRARRRREAEHEAGAPLHAGQGAAVAALGALLLLGSAGSAAAQSDWARGDRAWRAGEWARADSLYGRRVRRGGPDELRVNRALARSRAGGAAAAERDLSALAPRPTRGGRAAAFDLGTMLGERGEVDRSLEALRAALKRDPRDEDARWNYEVMLRRKQEQEQRNRQPKPQPPRPSPARPQPQPQAMQPQPPPRPAPQPPRPAGGAGSMSRAEADRLLDALNDLERAQRERQRRMGTKAEDRLGRDW